MSYVPSKHQLVDILTKGLNSSMFHDLVFKLGMEDIYSLACGGVLSCKQNKKIIFLLCQFPIFVNRQFYDLGISQFHIMSLVSYFFSCNLLYKLHIVNLIHRTYYFSSHISCHISQHHPQYKCVQLSSQTKSPFKIQFYNRLQVEHHFSALASECFPTFFN